MCTVGVHKVLATCKASWGDDLKATFARTRYKENDALGRTKQGKQSTKCANYKDKSFDRGP